MDAAEFRRRLQSHPTFHDLERWTISSPGSGRVSPNKCRLRCGEQDYFAKEVKENEKRILGALTGLGLSIAPRILFPELLAQDIAVYAYIPGAPLPGKTLPPALIERYAQMQNVLNQAHHYQPAGVLEGAHLNRADDGFYRGSICRCMKEGYDHLLALRAHTLPVVEAFIALADHVRANLASIADDLAGMPFAWLHNDFRELHILGDPPHLIDWGSSYGHGPFLFDLAPYLAHDPHGLDLFVAHSDIGRDAARADVERWLYAALCASLGGFLLWRVGDAEFDGVVQDRDACRSWLEYEYPAYRGILDRAAGKGALSIECIC